MHLPKNKKVIKQKRINGGGVNLHLECGHILRLHDAPEFRPAISACTECGKIGQAES